MEQDDAGGDVMSSAVTESGGLVSSSAAVAALARDTLVARRYRVVRFLARGGMGEVYEVFDTELGVAVALKTVRAQVAGDGTALERFKREIRLARTLTHPNLCRTFDLGRDDALSPPLLFLTMELLEGETLATRIGREGRLEPRATLSMVREMASALAAAHAAGVVHRDFKSANVFLVPSGVGTRAVVTDFGIALETGVREAAHADRLTGTGMMIGTPAYMAPEQVRGEAVGPPADLYALGVVMFEMWSGRLPFAGGSALDVATRRLIAEPPPLAALVPDLAPELAAVVARCLRREPAERYASAADLLAALDGPSGAVAVDVRAIPRALPAERDVFIGRSDELLALAEQLGVGARLVTVLGPGGTGKTRLVTRYGWTHLARWPGGVWFADLSEAQSRDAIAGAVAGALDLAPGAGDLLLRVGHAIAARDRCLVILDNFEQVTEHAQATVGLWLERAAHAAFVVTSRERLAIPGEQVMLLEPLPLATEGVLLFVARARAQKPDFALTDANRTAVLEIVRRLDGLPLAIELAAARARVLAPEQLLLRLQERFQILVGVRGGQARKETLEAAIDWSWTLLTAWERAALAQASVFTGGFTLEAAEAVFELSRWPQAPPAVDVVQALLDKSLLRTWTPPAPGRLASMGPRFGMYLSIQEYAAAKLATPGAVESDASGPAAQQAAFVRHGGYYARFASAEAVQGEVENLVAACRRGILRGDGETATAALTALWDVLEARGPLLAPAELGREVLGVASLGVEERLRAARIVGIALQAAGRREEARPHLEAALGLAREVGDRRVEGIVHASMAIHHLTQGRAEEGQWHLEESLALAREVGNRLDEGRILDLLGEVHMEHGRADLARWHHEEALALAREVGSRRVEGFVLCHLGDLHLAQGRIAQARRHFEEALALAREVSHRGLEGFVLLGMGNVHRQEGRSEEMARDYAEALALAREVSNRPFEGLVLCHLGGRLREQRRWPEARSHLDAALAIACEVGDPGFEGVVRGALGGLEADQGRLREARVGLDQGLALVRAGGNPIEIGKLLCQRGTCEVLVGDLAGARATLVEADGCARTVAAGPDSPLGQQIDRLRVALADAPAPPA